MHNCSSYWHRVVLIFLLLIVQDMQAASIQLTEEDLLINNSEQFDKLHYPLRQSESSINYENTDVSYEDYTNMKKPEHETAQKTKDNMMIENENNKAYIEYVVEAAPYKESNAESKHAPKKPKVLFKADKNLQRVEKKSWKIPIKILTLPNEQRHSNQQMMEQLSEAIDG
jgi:hypothetical protein